MITDAHFRPLAELTDAQLRERLAFHNYELDQEWCATLILPQIQAIRAELERRGIPESCHADC